MGISVRTNCSAINANKNLKKNNAKSNYNDLKCLEGKSAYYTLDGSKWVVSSSISGVAEQLGTNNYASVNINLDRAYLKVEDKYCIDNDTDETQTARLLSGAVRDYAQNNIDGYKSLMGKKIYYKNDGSKVLIEDENISNKDIMKKLGVDSEDKFKSSDIYVNKYLSNYDGYFIEKETEIKVPKEVHEPLVLQIGETSSKADKLVVPLYNLHTDELFKSEFGYEISSVIEVNRKNNYATITGTLNSSAEDTHNKKYTESIYTYEFLEKNAIINNEDSHYENGRTLDISTQVNAMKNIDYVKTVTNDISIKRGDYGSMQNRLEYTVSNINNTVENMESAKSRIKDTDMAKTMMEYTQINILNQAAQSMLAQANTKTENVLQLLG